MKYLNLKYNLEHLNDISDENDPIKIATKKFQNHPSIMKINKNIPKSTTFSFDKIESDLINKIIDKLDSRKRRLFGGILDNCLTGVSVITAKFLHTVWNDEVFKDSKFPSELKLADAVPAFKQDVQLQRIPSL